MNEPVFFTTSGGSELIKSGPGMIMGFQVTSGSPLSGTSVATSSIAFFDGLAAGPANTMLAHARVGIDRTYNWSPNLMHPFSRGLWLQVYSGSPVVTTSYF